MKPKALMITPTLGEKEACGIGLYGKLWSDSLLKMDGVNFEVIFTDSIVEAVIKIKDFEPDIVFYMWNRIASDWMSNPNIRSAFPKTKHINIHHDMNQEMIDNFDINLHNGGFEYAITMNPVLEGNKQVFIANKLLPPGPTIPIVDNPIPVIGYQGFALSYKGIARLAQIVNSEFDECIFRLHMPRSWFLDRDGFETELRKNEIAPLITKPGIKIEYSHDIKNTQELVNWLSQNSINCYFYFNSANSGLASAPDYALAARRPIAVSSSEYFKNFYPCTPSVVIYEPFSLRQIIENGTEPLNELYEAYSEKNFHNDWFNAINYFLGV